MTSFEDRIASQGELFNGVSNTFWKQSPKCFIDCLVFSAWFGFTALCGFDFKFWSHLWPCTLCSESRCAHIKGVGIVFTLVIVSKTELNNYTSYRYGSATAV
jgi:disulfide bond formation protein DsbB